MESSSFNKPASFIPAEPPPAAVKQVRSGAVGNAFQEIGDMAEFFGESIKGLRRVPRYLSEVLRQAAILIRGSTIIIFAMCFFIGMTVIVFAYFLEKAVGAQDFTGVFAGIVMPRAAVPIMFGYVFSAKVGCGIVAEVGAMRINDELDAYEVEGVNPMSYVVGTRLVGALIYVPVAVTVGLLGGYFGSYFQSVTVYHAVAPGTFTHFNWASENLTDNLQAYLNMGSMAMFIVIVSCFYGYFAKGGPAGVGAACARSLLVNIVMVHVIATFWVFIFFGINPSLPIGG
jgi:phospholipid/cholesterol/gamma-HCH transport system permease protein